MIAETFVSQPALWLLPAMTLALLVHVLAVGGGAAGYRFRAQAVMTGNEAEFYGRLARALPECFVFPQVAMSALIEPRSMGRSRRLAAFRSISQKRVDFALLAKDFNVVCVVELDDRTHNPLKDAKRDAWLASAGIRTIRWGSRNKPSEAAIRQAVLNLIKGN